MDDWDDWDAVEAEQRSDERQLDALEDALAQLRASEQRCAALERQLAAAHALYVRICDEAAGDGLYASESEIAAMFPWPVLE